MNQLPEAVIGADPDGHIIRWNSAAVQLFGFSEQEALGQSLDLIIPPALREAHWQGFRKAVEQGTTQHEGEAVFTGALHKSGRRVYANMVFGLIKDAAGEVSGVVATARKALPHSAALHR